VKQILHDFASQCRLIAVDQREFGVLRIHVVGKPFIRCFEFYHSERD